MSKGVELIYRIFDDRIILEICSDIAICNHRRISFTLSKSERYRPRSSSGLGRRPLTAVTRVQIPYGVQIRGSQYFNWLPLLIACVLRIRRNGIQIGFRIFYISWRRGVECKHNLRTGPTERVYKFQNRSVGNFSLSYLLL